MRKIFWCRAWVVLEELLWYCRVDHAQPFFEALIYFYKTLCCARKNWAKIACGNDNLKTTYGNMLEAKKNFLEGDEDVRKFTGWW